MPSRLTMYPGCALSHSMLPNSDWNVPLGQGVCSSAPELGEWKPGSALLQVVIPDSFCHVPGEHGVFSVAFVPVTKYPGSEEMQLS